MPHDRRNVQIQGLKNMGYNISRAKLSEGSKNKFYITNAKTSEKVSKSAEVRTDGMLQLPSSILQSSAAGCLWPAVLHAVNNLVTRSSVFEHGCCACSLKPSECVF